VTVSVVIPCYGRSDLLDACLQAVGHDRPLTPYEVVVVDNGSPDDTAEVAEAHGARVVSLATNLGFSVGCNRGAAEAVGDPVVFLNNDTEPEPGWLDALVAPFVDPDVGVVGARLHRPDGTPHHTGVEFRRTPNLEAYETDWERPAGQVPAVTGACMAVARRCWRTVGGFDQGFWNGYEDVDLCLKARRAGWDVYYQPAARVMHHVGGTGPEKRFERVRENVRRLNERWAQARV